MNRDSDSQLLPPLLVLSLAHWQALAPGWHRDGFRSPSSFSQPSAAEVAAAYLNITIMITSVKPKSAVGHRENRGTVTLMPVPGCAGVS